MIGIYLFRRDFLLQLSRWPQMPLEKAEKVDMLRIIEKGFRLQAFVSRDMVSVDTPEDLRAVEPLVAQDALYKELFTMQKCL